MVAGAVDMASDRLRQRIERRACGGGALLHMSPFAGARLRPRLWGVASPIDYPRHRSDAAVVEESSGPASRRSRRLQNVSTNRVDFRGTKETRADSRNRFKRQHVYGLRPQLAHRQVVEKLPTNR
jgi:hypothetical protein